MTSQQRYMQAIGISIVGAWGVLVGVVFVFQGLQQQAQGSFTTIAGLTIMMAMCWGYVKMTTGVSLGQSIFIGVAIPLAIIPVCVGFAGTSADAFTASVVPTTILQDASLYKVGLTMLWIGTALHVAAGMLEYLGGDEPQALWKRNVFFGCSAGLVLLVLIDMLNAWMRTTMSITAMQDHIALASMGIYVAVTWTLLTVLLLHEQTIRGTRWTRSLW